MAQPSEDDVAGVMLGCLEAVGPAPPTLVAGDVTGRIAAATAGVAWLRRATGKGCAALPWPETGPFASAVVRLPKAREELAMVLHAVAGLVAPGGRIWLYGANDEGVRSATAPLQALLGPVETLETRRHCRVMAATRPERIEGLKSQLADWRSAVEVAINGQGHTLASYPGLFAHGRLDAGTALLLGALPTLKPGAQVLDFGCGTGVIALAVLARQPAAKLVLIDNDAVAVAAACENVSAAQAKCVSELAAAGLTGLDAILSNPPIHAGKVEDHATLEALVRQAPASLKRGGVLQIVVQRRINARAWMEKAFGNCSTVTEDGSFRVLKSVRA